MRVRNIALFLLFRVAKAEAGDETPYIGLQDHHSGKGLPATLIVIVIIQSLYIVASWYGEAADREL